jgi:uncharacterized protein
MAINITLAKFSVWQKTAFAAGLLERMLPNYHMFAEAVQFGDAALLRNQLDLIWQRLAGQKVKINFEAQLLKLELQIPEPEQYDFFGVYPALDCTMALMILLQSIQDKDVDGFIEISKLSENSVRNYVELTLTEAILAEQPNAEADVEINLTEADIAAHPLMQWEFDTQQELFELIASAPENQATCTNIKALVLAEGISNLGIEIN